MPKEKTMTVNQLKKKCKELSEEEKVKVTFSRNQNLVLCEEITTYKSEMFQVEFKELNNNVYLNLKDTRRMNFNVFFFILDYFTEYVQLTNRKNVLFKIDNSQALSTSTSVFNNWLDGLLNSVGIMTEPTTFLINREKTNHLSNLYQTIKSAFKNFKNAHPAFYYVPATPGNISFLLYNHASKLRHTFTSFKIIWQGYDGTLSFNQKDGNFYFEEFGNSLEGNIELPSSPFSLNDLEERLFLFLNEIPGKMGLLNALAVPHYQLQQLINQTINSSSNINAEEIMRHFEELGYCYDEIENEAARLQDSMVYAREKEHPFPRYALERKHAIHQRILEIFNHYLILMSSPALKGPAEYAIVKSVDEIEPTVNKLADKMEIAFKCI
jgi:hypothetical protein